MREGERRLEQECIVKEVAKRGDIQTREQRKDIGIQTERKFWCGGRGGRELAGLTFFFFQSGLKVQVKTEE